DIMMPELDGYGVLHLLSKDPATANIPFIFLTAKTEMRDFRVGMNLGADDYITKPFDGLELLNIIELRLKKNDLIKTTFRNTITDIDDFFFKTKQLPDFQKLSDHRRSRTYKKKEFVFVEGEQPRHVYFVDKGLVKTFKANNDGKELITGLHRNGDFFGFVSLLEDKPNNESAIVLKESHIYMIPQQDFLTLIYANKEIARKFISMLASNLYEAENKLLELAYQSVRQRVATVLIKLNHQTESTNEDQHITVARKDLSGMVGTTTESLNRTLVDFKNEGLIEIFDKGLKIVQHSKLEKVRN
ncbi:MAG: cyclic nucleotide-binding domain-containing protein, partial [Bacteroidetes bacterium]|nr:cyclic nucleotide-binding domain-containing protein [Bacteroidota bacterium]